MAGARVLRLNGHRSQGWGYVGLWGGGENGVMGGCFALSCVRSALAREAVHSSAPTRYMPSVCLHDAAMIGCPTMLLFPAPMPLGGGGYGGYGGYRGL